ncbi:MAG: hypothetical protein J0L82_14890 [Deltaproteobacteria bacterium]|nr:hypothetical protein [Deltaproteobacteria bacterium]
MNDAIHLAVDHVASVSASGAASEVVKAPYQLLFVPAEGVALSENASDFRLELAKVPTGTAIYEVFGKESEAKGSPIKRIGRIITESEFAASRYQDETLYFQHAGSELKSGYILRWLHLPY